MPVIFKFKSVFMSDIRKLNLAAGELVFFTADFLELIL